MPEYDDIVLRQSEYDKMCKIQQQFFKTCVVPDDFDVTEDVPKTMYMALEYQIWKNIEKGFVEQITKL